VLNEMGLEYEGGEAQAKRRAMLALLEAERGAGAPIQALGIQSHLDAASRPGRHSELRAFLREVAASGLKVMITELDVDDRRVPGGVAERDAAVADAYRAFLDLVLEEAPVLSVATWGLTDRRSWLGAGAARPARPLPLDRALRRKPAWRAVAAALRGRPPRRPEAGSPREPRPGTATS
jgi:endo-1,4-beta-xylanase